MERYDGVEVVSVILHIIIPELIMLTVDLYYEFFLGSSENKDCTFF